jgi:Protein of unknown function (DUF4229)
MTESIQTESIQTESGFTESETGDSGTARSAEAEVGAAAAESVGPQSAAVLNTRHAALRYTTLRLALFVVSLAVLWAIAEIAGMDLNSQLSKLSLLAVALLLSSVVSLIVLSKQRDAMSAGLVARSQKLSQKLDQAASFEDE